MRRVAFLVVWIVAGCARDDGAPDPTPRPLVACDADAGPDDPLACPTSEADAGTQVDGR